MRIISKKILVDFYEKHPDAKSAIESWHAEAKEAVWNTFIDIKKMYSAASPIKNNRCVFNICGNKYRLVTKIEFRIGIIFIRFIGTHDEYDKLNAEEI
jgi:mRNA interferase HigB